MTTLPINETIESLGGCDRATAGVNRVAKRWQDSDGDGDTFKIFCENSFVSTSCQATM
jgi:hypothetical protein